MMIMMIMLALILAMRTTQMGILHRLLPMLVRIYLYYLFEYLLLCKTVYMGKAQDSENNRILKSQTQWFWGFEFYLVLIFLMSSAI